MAWAHARPVEVAVLLCALVLAISLLVLARWLSDAPAARSWLLLVLRASVVAGLVLILLGPSRLDLVRKPGRDPSVFYLIDASRSMALGAQESRLEQVRRTIEETNGLLRGGPTVKVESYRFGERLAALSGVTVPDAIDNETHLASAVEQLPARFTDGLPIGVVVFSDGRTTGQEALDATARGYASLGVPVHVVPVGDPRTAGDVAVANVIAPRDPPAGARVPVSVVVRSQGYSGSRAEIQIRYQDEAAREPLASLPILLSDGEQTHQLAIEAGRGGSRILVAAVTEQDHEAIRENNRVPFQMRSQAKKVRVIYMEGGPPNLFRRLSEALAEDADIECLDIGTVFRAGGRTGLARKNDPARGYPATRAELFEYDVVICSDIARENFSQDQLKWTVDLVAERGGGFAMVGGNKSYGAGEYHKTVWNGLIPVDMGQWGLERGFENIIYWGTGRLFRVVVPPEAQGHPIWHFGDDAARNRAILGKMPVFYGCNLVDRLKPAAMVLGARDRPLLSVGKAPIFSCESFGQGRTFAMLTDTTPDWGRAFESSWGENGDSRYFRRFWRNVVSWLGENSAGRSRRLRVETDKLVYAPGEPVRLSARAFDTQKDLTTRYRLEARLGLPGAPAESASVRGMVPRADRPEYQVDLACPSVDAGGAGAFHAAVAQVIAFDGSREVARADVEIQVREDPPEFRDPRPDPERLAALAEASGGQVIHDARSLAAVLRNAKRNPEVTIISRTPLWDHSPVWGAASGVCSAWSGFFGGGAVWRDVAHPAIGPNFWGVLNVGRGRDTLARVVFTKAFAPERGHHIHETRYV